MGKDKAVNGPPCTGATRPGDGIFAVRNFPGSGRGAQGPNYSRGLLSPDVLLPGCVCV